MFDRSPRMAAMDCVMALVLEIGRGLSAIGLSRDVKQYSLFGSARNFQSAVSLLESGG